MTGRLIDADVLLENLDGMMAVSPTGYIHGDTVADMIGDAPTVDAVPVRHGKWIASETNGDNMGRMIENKIKRFIDHYKDEAFYGYKGMTVELIRCKDCKHFTGKWCILNSRKEFDPEDRLVNEEGFCAWAERKEE